MNEAIGNFLGGDVDTRELIDVTLDEDEPPEVRRTARETLADKMTDADLVELLDGWEVHIDFGSVSISRDLTGVGTLVKAYIDVVGPEPSFFTNLALAIGEDFRNHLQEIAEKIAEEGALEAGEPEITA